MGGKNWAPTQEDLAWMIEDYEKFGTATYGAETLFAAYPLIDTFFSSGIDT
eukprot:CAMPEP_0205800762 /NCGR_PEP_ID=MMETSP0205-20121125/2536_1 /ASSEMBLY_ACC=CAM_ASM_000278 /TAXON_ID=36767 /ORGANISM="Euplotes focardii, Strain TN1" /LENGTH=50 /DNA_ID=CAMNT_0053064405 /DNA_START=11 /DNA_END=160 /DNA_ORIENTATION=+